jgi:hypothetical protein
MLTVVAAIDAMATLLRQVGALLGDRQYARPEEHR